VRETVTIKLAKPLVTHNGPLSRIVLREPTFDEFLSFGDPYTVAGSAEGAPFIIENVEVIKQYLTVCLVEPKDPALLSQAGARVAREVKQALLGFFQPAGEAGEDSATSETNSSSAGSESAPSKSAN